jgi:hypothetical protein
LSSNNPCGDYLTQAVNLSGIQGTLIARGRIYIDGKYISFTQQYKVLNNENLGYNGTGIVDILDKIKDDNFGSEFGLSPNTKVLISFLILFGILLTFGTLEGNKNFGMGTVLFILGYMFFMSYINFLTIFSSSYEIVNRFGLFFIGCIMGGAIMLREK